MEKFISKQALQRMPYYLKVLKSLKDQGIENVSAPSVAKNMDISDIQVRKDFACVSSGGGKPKSGFPVEQLISDIEKLLGYNNVKEALIVGSGNLGRALLMYDGFKKEGMEIIAAFDNNPDIIGKEINGVKVLSTEKITDLSDRFHIKIGIICVPPECAQSVCDMMVFGGIRGIMNFSAAKLQVPDNVLVRNISMAAELAVLSHHIKTGGDD